MPKGLIIDGLQYAGYCLELGLLVLLLWRGYARRLAVLWFYVSAYFGIDAILRPWTLHRYGPASVEYFYLYWLSDALLALGTFLLICAFFRRACSHDRKIWTFVRPILLFILAFIVADSALTLQQHYKHLFTAFIFVFNQNLYFTGAVLNTVLYLMLLRFENSDDRELELLVCGLGIQYAGPAANFALVHLTGNSNPAARLLALYLPPFCALGMLAVWFYAAASSPCAISTDLAGDREGLPAPA
jgi:hypothetical protein